MEENKWERVAEDSPLRCQATIATKGQCFNKRMENSEYCPAHGGNRGNRKAKQDAMRMYRVERWQDRFNEKEDHGKIKSLTSEIAILRSILEERLRQCHSEYDLVLHSISISKLVTDIEKLVVSCNRLDMQLGNMLDSAQAVQWMGDIVEIIGAYITDSDVLSQIADEIQGSFLKIQKGQTS